MEQPYHQFTVRDFVLDDAFRRWILQPDEENMTFWHTFMLRHPEQQTAIDEAASIVLHLRASHDDLTDSSLLRIRQVLEQAFDDQQSLQTTVRPLPIWRRPRFMWQIAASLTGLLLLAGGAFWYVRQPRQERVHTAYGENRTVTLPDGSTVLLNGNTTLTFATNWQEDKPREVWIDGEGYFNITKKYSSQPTGKTRVAFVTHTPNLDITVLGTQFNVSSRRGHTDVTLVEGRVQLAKPGQPANKGIELKPGQVASARPSLETVAVRSEQPRLRTSWIQHQFVFDNTALSDIAQQLKDTYGLELVFENSDLSARRFTGNLSNEDIETLVATLAATFNLTTDRSGNQIVLRQAK
ncbi:anti-FecI sigma factor, FecR [Fibrisoma limi BUZ 3]|uniref:Anti-FecI sigma factor, FecR n=1 Tax=Fibrisoma limi BUZ 3 TaxID=1185876 RepID=I2GMF1_9BACT|nr:FecR domain-containing protein [Fibrisoma limi]CCH55078.1 anti-FecI sigma factor, FecR [Fibrisoma limi BUZ 3]